MPVHFEFSTESEPGSITLCFLVGSKRGNLADPLYYIFFSLAYPVVSHHGLQTPNEGKNERYLKNWADVADKICLKIWEWEWIFGRAVKTIFSLCVRSPWGYLFSSTTQLHTDFWAFSMVLDVETTEPDRTWIDWSAPAESSLQTSINSFPAFVISGLLLVAFWMGFENSPTN